ncbi:auxin-responsive protein IAA1-like [Bidens hawaiensis]|uniref:auxin-responsive protein IAA1-like n=1 Tax=Bidens hawaiensis TaxID=980011 RepID=UPI004049D302
MSSDTSEITSEFTTYALDLNETELTLGLPGGSLGGKSRRKRGLSDAINVNSSSDENYDAATKPPPDEEQVAGWPPVALYRKNVVKSNNKFVKVAVDGAPYMRKVDLESYDGYQQLQCDLVDKFSYFTLGNALIEKKWMDNLVNQINYVSTYEDNDGDWMLVGDVPWKMFVQTCRRIRLMRSSEAING